jgi:hypothetical protein
VDLKLVVIEDAGGRFFYWNTVLFLSVLLVAFVVLLSDQRTRLGPASKVLIIWLVLTLVSYHNNVVPRPVFELSATGQIRSVVYEDQLRQQCSMPVPLPIQIYGGPAWNFRLGRPQIARLCYGLS